MTRTVLFVLAATLWAAAGALAQSVTLPVNDRPNPYRTIDQWAQLPEGRRLGSSAGIDVDRQRNIWVAERCGANTCKGSSLAPILQFAPSGQLLRSFGAGLLVFPHGLHVDPDGNIWVTDGQGDAGRGHQVLKFSPDGRVLLTLGKPGGGFDNDGFNQPSDVLVAPNGDVFVADGHGDTPNARIVKFTKEGRFIKTWGMKGTARGQLDVPHALAMDSRGRLFVANRRNNQVDVFDQDGVLLDSWKQFGRPSGLFIDKDDVLYVADSESSAERNPGWIRGIRVGSARDGRVMSFIPDPTPTADPNTSAEGVAVGLDGAVYGAVQGAMKLQKHVRR